MKKRDFTTAIRRIQTLSRDQFGRLYQDHHDADRDWIHFQRDRVGFYLKAPSTLQEALWGLVRG